MTDKTQPYHERLIQFIEEKNKKKFNLEEVKSVVNEFAEHNYQLIRQNYTKLPFGKYKGKTVKSVLDFDKNYLQWLVKQSVLDNFPELKKHIKELF